MAYCPNCSNAVEAHAATCTVCGADFGEAAEWQPTDRPTTPVRKPRDVQPRGPHSGLSPVNFTLATAMVVGPPLVMQTMGQLGGVGTSLIGIGILLLVWQYGTQQAAKPGRGRGAALANACFGGINALFGPIWLMAFFGSSPDSSMILWLAVLGYPIALALYVVGLNAFSRSAGEDATAPGGPPESSRQ